MARDGSSTYTATTGPASGPSSKPASESPWYSRFELSHSRCRSSGRSTTSRSAARVEAMTDGVGEAVNDSKKVKAAANDLGLIAGQRPVITKARQSIAAFKLREGMPVGASVTLRSDKMWFFLDRLIGTAIPRIRDFRGLSTKSFDGRGNFAMGVTEQIVFPEIDYDKIDKIRGLDIAISTSAKTDEQGRALLRAFNFPLREAG